jgi:hypothetical protein
MEKEQESLKERTDKSAGSIYLDNEVWDILAIKSKELRRSTSWMANEVLRQSLGLVPKGGG